MGDAKCLPNLQQLYIEVNDSGRVHNEGKGVKFARCSPPTVSQLSALQSFDLRNLRKPEDSYAGNARLKSRGGATAPPTRPFWTIAHRRDRHWMGQPVFMRRRWAEDEAGQSRLHARHGTGSFSRNLG